MHAGVLVLATVLASAPARADEPARSDDAPPAAAAPPPPETGFKMGPFRMHASLGVSAGYDSNVFYTGPADSSPAIVGAPLLRITPRLEGETGVPTSIDGRLYLGLAWNQYFTRPAIGQSDLAIELGGNLVFNPTAPISFLLQENFIRYVDSAYSPTVANFNPFNQGDGPRLDRDVNRAAIGVRLKPGHGAFSVDLLFANTLYYYESRDLDLGRSMLNEVELKSKWKFFPKTALIHEFSFGNIHYFCKGSCNAGYYNLDSYPLRTYLGLVGLLTARLEFLVKVGYGNSFHRLSDPANTGKSYEGPLAAAQLTYRAGVRTRFSLFYEHTFVDSIYANYYTLDVGKLTLDQGIAERVLVHAEAILGYLDYDTPPVIPMVDQTNCPDRKEVRLGGNLNVDFYIFPWLTVGAAYSISANITNCTTNSISGTDDPSYIRHVFMGNVTARY